MKQYDCVWEPSGFSFRQVEKDALGKHQKQESSRALTYFLALSRKRKKSYEGELWKFDKRFLKTAVIVTHSWTPLRKRLEVSQTLSYAEAC